MSTARVRSRRRGTGLLAVAALLGATACGSTVQSRGDALVAGGQGGSQSLTTDGTGQALGDPAAEGLGTPGEPGLGGEGLGDPNAAAGGAPGAPGAPAQPGQPGQPGSAPQGGAPQAGAPQGGAPQGGAPQGGQPGGAPGQPQQGSGAQGPGVTDKEIFVGVAYSSNGEAANRAIGAGGITQGDQKANADAVIAEINERGGVAGRKLTPVFFTYDAQSSQPGEAQDAEACAKFTQDNKVFVAGSGLTENFDACMAKAGVLQINSGDLIDRDRARFQKYPDYFDVGTMTQERMMNEQLATLGRRDYFAGWDPSLGRPGQGKAKVGVITYDEPQFVRPLEQVFLPGLAKAGNPVPKELVYRVTQPDNQSEVARTSGEVQNAVLRFREQGVTHVALLDDSGVIGIAYANAARNQRYLPRLGVNSATAMQALFDSKVFSNEQLAGAVGLGWFPSIDLPAGQGDRFLGPSAKQCLDIIKRRTGQTFDSTNAASLALIACDTLFLTAASINNAGKTINRATVRASLEGLGGKFPPALIPASFFSPARHDGLQRGFDMAWDTQCPCAKYLDGGHDIA